MFAHLIFIVNDLLQFQQIIELIFACEPECMILMECIHVYRLGLSLWISTVSSVECICVLNSSLLVYKPNLYDLDKIHQCFQIQS